MCSFVCGTMSQAKVSLHWSVIPYQITFEWHSECGLETSIPLDFNIPRLAFIQG